MKKMFCAAVLFAIVVAGGGFAQKSGVGWMSRYWDGCMPTCSWLQNVEEKQGPVKYGASRACDVNNKEIDVPYNPPSKFCAKDGGPAYTCWNQIPFVDPNNPLIAYGYAATPFIECGICYELTFTGRGGSGTDARGPHTALAASGKKLIIMARNTGSDVSAAQNQFDFMAPGGGLGQYDCFTEQTGISVGELGNTYGGFARDCDDEVGRPVNHDPVIMANPELFQNCMRPKCHSVFGQKPEHEPFLQGCLFYADWMMAVNNPEINFKEVDCPQPLIDGYVSAAFNYKGETVPDTVIILSDTTVGAKASYIVNVDGFGSMYTDIEFKFISKNEYFYGFSMWVNDKPIPYFQGTPTPGGGYQTVTVSIPRTAQFIKGYDNLVEIESQAGADVEYIRIIGKKPVETTTSIRQNIAKSARHTVSKVVFKTGLKGLTALLPANHGYTSYRLINLQGREIKRGKIGENTASLNFDNVKPGALFLKLEGKNTSTMVKTIVSR